MNKKAFILLMLLLPFYFVSCASIGGNIRESENFMEVGMIIPTLRNNNGVRYFVAYGKVNMYWMGLVPVFKLTTYVAIQIHPESGRIIKIVTHQPSGYIDDLIGGIDVIDIFPVGSWNEATSNL